MNAKFEILVGDRLPDFTHPLAIVAATTVNIANTALERYILLPGTSTRPKQMLSERLSYKIDLSNTPKEIISFESIFGEGIEYCENDIELKFYSAEAFDQRAIYLKDGRYRFYACPNHRLFTYKWRFGFAQELRQIGRVTPNVELQEYLRLIDGVSLTKPDSKDPMTDL